MAYKDVILAESSLLGYWQFGDASGSVTDSKNSNNGTANGSPTYGTAKVHPGLSGTSMTFVKGSSQYVSLGDVNSLEGLSAMSLECWVNLDALPSGAEVLNALMGKNNMYYLTYYNTGVLYQWWISMRFGDAPVAIQQTLSTGVPYHVVCTWNGTTVTLYVNNVSVGSATQNGAPLAGVTDPVEFMRFNGTYYTSAKAQHFAIYNTALSATKVQNHYRAGTDPQGGVKWAAQAVKRSYRY